MCDAGVLQQDRDGTWIALCAVFCSVSSVSLFLGQVLSSRYLAVVRMHSGSLAFGLYLDIAGSTPVSRFKNQQKSLPERHENGPLQENFRRTPRIS